ncbi:MAG TPA: holo-ACP synthase [Verrucomicrobiae bacterium]|nr:holo-ACP synthase [Verrucomicrobiae bacterium]
MIIGVGIDIIEVSRIESSHQKFGDRFLNRLLHPNEIQYCLSHRTPGPFLAARFAAKEAISKAFGTGIGAQLSWHDMEVGRKPSGEPFVILHDKGKALAAARGAAVPRISLSHTQNYAAAVAILEAEANHAAVP